MLTKWDHVTYKPCSQQKEEEERKIQSPQSEGININKFVKYNYSDFFFKLYIFPATPITLTIIAKTSIVKDKYLSTFVKHLPCLSNLKATRDGNINPNARPVVAPVNLKAIHILGINVDPR